MTELEVLRTAVGIFAGVASVLSTFGVVRWVINRPKRPNPQWQVNDVALVEWGNDLVMRTVVAVTEHGEPVVELSRGDHKVGESYGKPFVKVGRYRRRLANLFLWRSFVPLKPRPLDAPTIKADKVVTWTVGNCDSSDGSDPR